jgi:hypothetical protein
VGCTPAGEKFFLVQSAQAKLGLTQKHLDDYSRSAAFIGQKLRHEDVWKSAGVAPRILNFFISR